MKILKSLALASLLIAPMVSVASTTSDLGPIATDSSYVLNSVVLPVGIFNNNYDFSTIGNVVIDLSIFDFGKTVANSKTAVPAFSGLTAILDGHALVETDTVLSAGTDKHFYFQYLALDDSLIALTSQLHHLVVTGTSSFATASYSGSIDVAAVPLPAGVWLFMSGLLGLAYTSKKKHNLFK
jgi:hypothetical protein